MGGVRHKNFSPRRISPVQVIGLDQHHTGKLTVGASGRLERHLVHAKNLS